METYTHPVRCYNGDITDTIHTCVYDGEMIKTIRPKVLMPVHFQIAISKNPILEYVRNKFLEIKVASTFRFFYVTKLIFLNIKTIMIKYIFS